MPYLSGLLRPRRAVKRNKYIKGKKTQQEGRGEKIREENQWSAFEFTGQPVPH